jgi:peptide deformylase
MRIETYPSRILRAKCLPVREFADKDLARARRMLELMYEAQGVGLAGPQVAWQTQIMTLDIEQSHRGDRIFFNPRIIDTAGETEEEEGCLSVPGVRAPVKRAERVVVAAYNLRGEHFEREAAGLEARAWQHELDHLSGVLFIDRLEPTTLVTVRQQLKELEQEAEEEKAG